MSNEMAQPLQKYVIVGSRIVTDCCDCLRRCIFHQLVIYSFPRKNDPTEFIAQITVVV